MSSPTSTAGCGGPWPGAARMPSSPAPPRSRHGASRAVTRPTAPSSPTSPTSRVAPGSPPARGRRRPGDDVAPGGTSLEVACRWPQPSSSTSRSARGSSLTDLVDGNAKPLPVVVSGTYEPTGVDEGLWVDDPLGLAGVSRLRLHDLRPVRGRRGLLRPHLRRVVDRHLAVAAERGGGHHRRTPRGAGRRRAGHRRAAARGRHPARRRRGPGRRRRRPTLARARVSWGCPICSTPRPW